MENKYRMSKGILEPLMKGEKITYPKYPIVQLLDFKLFPGNELNRYRLVLSDGKYSIKNAVYILKSTENFNYSINSIIRITHYVISLFSSSQGEKKMIVVSQMDHIASGNKIGIKIGNPIPLPSNNSPTTSTSAITKSNNNVSKKTTTQTVSTPKFTPTRTKQLPNSNGSKVFTMEKMEVPSVCTPIMNVNPYNSRWCIRGRVKAKSHIKNWSNSRGEGKLFSFDVVDESGDIRIAVFNEECSRFHSIIEVDKVFYISGGTVKFANNKFNTSTHDYEINLNSDSKIMQCEEVCNITISYNFTPIADISKKTREEKIDVIGIVRSVTNVQQFVSRAGKNLTKREVILVDTSLAAISLVLWGNDATTFDGTNNPVLLVNKATVMDFNGSKNLSMLSGSSLRLNPNITEARSLKIWFNSGALDNITVYLSKKSVHRDYASIPYYTFRDAETSKFGADPKGFFYKNYAIVLRIKNENCVYKSCPSLGCNKKVNDVDGKYRCDKCTKTFNNFNYRLLLNILLYDHTGTVWATCFADEAERFLGKTSEEIGEMYEKDLVALNNFFYSKSCSKILVKIRVTKERFQDEWIYKNVIMTLDNNRNDLYRTLLERIEKSTGFQSSAKQLLK